MPRRPIVELADSVRILVFQQLGDDLERNDLNVVIGRINDHAMNNRSHPHWTKVREAQVQAAKELPRAAWIDTDDLNGSRNGIHATKEGFVKMGERFAKEAIRLVKTPKIVGREIALNATGQVHFSPFQNA